MNPSLTRFIALGAAVAAITPSSANVTLPPIFANGMVLQRDMPLPVWGKADPGESITVTASSGTKTAVADKDGKWLVRLDPLKLSAPFDLRVAGQNVITLTGVVAGDVWLASGQSNMEWALANSRNGNEDHKAGKANPIRLFVLKKRAVADPVETFEGSWLGHEGQKYSSAVAYYFAHELQEKTAVPIGIVASHWGGTPAEAWTDRETVLSKPKLQPVVEQWRQKQASYPAELEKFNAERLPAWQAAVEKAKADGRPEPDRPYLMNPNGSNGVGYLWNGMIKPLIPFGIKGVIWYQGESNSYEDKDYEPLFRTLITDWRRQWGQGDFPFYYVQLANTGKTIQTNPVETGWQGWIRVRDAQLRTLSLPNTGMAVTIDLADDPGNPGDVHYLNKSEVGERLARWALVKTYGQDIPFSGPIFDSASIEGPTVILHFKTSAGGLQSKGDVPLKGFAIAGPDKKWVWAQAEIKANTVILRSPEVTTPVSVRYDWANNPIGNLVGEAGLPASPFRWEASK